MQRASKAPKLDETGLSLDNKLDILGVALVVGSLALFFSSMSSTKGQLTEGINTFFSQLLGIGAIAVPIVMLAIGIWLIIRHFGDEAPVVDPVRILGVVLLYLCALLLFQFVESFNPDYAGINLSNPDELQLQLEISYNRGLGGGWVGAEMYYFLVTNITEAGMTVTMVGLGFIGVMLLLQISAAEVAIFIISLWRSFVDARRRRSQVREARARMAAAELAAAVESRVSVSKPAAAELPGRQSPALPAASSQEAEEPRPIPITMGGKTVTAFYGDDPNAAGANGAQNPGDQSAPRRIAGRLLGAVPVLGRSNSEPAPATTPPASGPQPAQTQGSSRRLGNLFNRTDSQAAPQKAEVAAAAPQAPAASAAQPERVPSPQPTAASIQTSPQTDSPEPTETPVRMGDLLRPPVVRQPSLFSTTTPAANTPAIASNGSSEKSRDSQDEDDIDTLEMRPATPKGTGPAPREPGQNSWARPVARPLPTSSQPGSLSERRERLNAIRSGQTAHPFASDTAASKDEKAPADQPPAASVPSAKPATEMPVHRPQPVINYSSDDQSDGKRNGAVVSSPVEPPTARTASPAFARPAGPPSTPSFLRKPRQWKLPDYRGLLNPGSESDFNREVLLKRARIIEETLQSFGAPGRVVEVNTGPVITQFGVEPDYLVNRSGKKSRVKVGAIAQLDKDLQLALGAKSIRIEAPVPGKGYVGVEVPNEEASLVSLRDVMESEDFQKTKAKSPLTIGLGQSVDGTPISADLSVMPHLLIAGTTGSGKSVCVNAIICSLLINNTPDRVKFIMVDPKRVELTTYNGIPHLVAPVVVDLERILGVLKWVTREMDERYKQFSDAGARNIEDFNKHLPEGRDFMPYIVVIIDELADLMMLAPDETERVITRIAALARATGIHLVIATQRPSVDVVTGLIKANFPARIAFAVAGGVDSRVILDQPGAERLLGRGDMLYMSGNSPAPVRLQGVFVSDEEIDNVTRYWKRQNTESPEPHIIKSIPLDDTPNLASTMTQSSSTTAQAAFWDDGDDDDDGIGLSDRVKDERDELYEQAVEMVQRLNKASVSLLQRRLRIGYTRAARLIDMMEAEGIVGPPTEGSKPREVLKEHKST